MRWQKLIRLERNGVSLAADINAAIAVNRGETGTTNTVESVSHARVVQDSGRRSPDSGRAKAPNKEEDPDDR
jgi:pyridoxal biosynthesis lyase PdxS